MQRARTSSTTPSPDPRGGIAKRPSAGAVGKEPDGRGATEAEARLAMIDPQDTRIDIPLGKDLTLNLTGHEGNYGLRMLNEEHGGCKVYLTAPMVLTKSEVTSLGQLFRVFARNHRREVPFLTDDEDRTGNRLAQTVTTIRG